MKMTPLEKRLFKEAIIREYQLKQEKLKARSVKKNTVLDDFFSTLKRLTPLNIAVGLIASALLVWYKGFGSLFSLILSAIVWMTLVSTFISAISKR